MDLREGIAILDRVGFTDVLLPFILIFALVFAILSNVNLFGAKKKNINVIIALVIAMSVIIPHVTGTYPPNGDVVDIMNKAMPNVSLVLVAVVMLLLMVGVWGVRFTGAGGFKGIIAIVSIGIVIYIFGAAAGWFGNGFAASISANPETVAVVVALLVFGIIIAIVTAEPKNPQESTFLGKMMSDFNKSWERPGGGEKE